MKRTHILLLTLIGAIAQIGLVSFSMGQQTTTEEELTPLEQLVDALADANTSNDVAAAVDAAVASNVPNAQIIEALSVAAQGNVTVRRTIETSPGGDATSYVVGVTTPAPEVIPAPEPIAGPESVTGTGQSSNLNRGGY